MLTETVEKLTDKISNRNNLIIYCTVLPSVGLQIKLYFIYSHHNGTRLHVCPCHKLLLQRMSFTYFLEFSQCNASHDTRTRLSVSLTRASFWPPVCYTCCWRSLLIMSSVRQSIYTIDATSAPFPSQVGSKGQSWLLYLLSQTLASLKARPYTTLLWFPRATLVLSCCGRK